MGVPLKRKVELALRDYLEAMLSFESVPVFAGHRVEARTLPCVVVYAESAKESDEFAAGAGVFDVAVKVFVLTQADDESIETHDERAEAVQHALSDSDAVCAALNAPASEPDERFIKGIHCYAIIEVEADEGRDERHFGEALSYRVICQDVDGPAAG